MATKQIDLKALLAQRTAGIVPAENAQEVIETAEQSIPKNLMFDAEATEFKPETKPVHGSSIRRLTVEEAKESDGEMSRFIDEVLVSGVDYGIVPRTSKPTLLKPGAEKILNFLGLVARTEVVNRIEDTGSGYFAYECKVYVIDRDGVVRGEGLGITNSKEGKYAKSTGFAVQNTIIKMAKKRALVDAVLNVGAISGRFTQDVEDMNLDPDTPMGRNPEELKQKPKDPRPATKKQLEYLEKLMSQHNTSAAAMSRYTKEHYGVDDYRQINGIQASELIEKYKALQS
ncbi:MAG: hypothetical protein IJ733_04620 [Lachnospiraceae bacterium]|nr:hypothetical protein [Lachnospiraceae bacterium]